MNRRVVFLFSGQGSQYFRMGKELFEQNRKFRRWMMALDDLVKAISGESVLHQLYEGNRSIGELFNRIFYTHPAIFMVEYSLAQMLLEQMVVPDLVLGSSLGEFAAATIAGALDVEDALELVVKQAVVFETYCPPGSMLAILHDVNLYHETPWLNGLSELAAVNHRAHFVVSGTVEHIQEIRDMLASKNILCDILPVSYAFHSSGIDLAEPYYKSLFKAKVYKQPSIPFISTLFGRSVTTLSHEYFWEVVRKPIRFSSAIQTLERDGYYHYVDVGPAGTLANLTKRNIHQMSLSKCYAVLSPFHQDVKNAAKIIDALTS